MVLVHVGYVVRMAVLIDPIYMILHRLFPLKTEAERYGDFLLPLRGRIIENIRFRHNREPPLRQLKFIVETENARVGPV